MFASASFGWDVLEISIPGGVSHPLVSGGYSMTPDWAPSGTHFIFAEKNVILDRQAGAEGFSRQLGSPAQGGNPQLSPDGG